MKRSSIGLLILLLGLAIWFLMQKKKVDTKTEEIAKEMKFNVDNADDIYKIFVVHRDKKPALLERKGKGWRLDGQFDANPYVMEGILEVFEKVRIQFVPSQVEVENNIPVMSTKGIKIETYDKSGNQLQKFYIGGVTQNEKGSHFYKEGGKKSYVMELPYGDVNVRQRFSIRYDDWKTRLIYDDRVEGIRSLKVEYPKKPSNGYVIENKKGEFTIRPVNSQRPKIDRELKPDVFEKYLIRFKGVNYASFNNEINMRDSVISRMPFVKQELVNTKGDTFSLSLWAQSRSISSPHQAHDDKNRITNYFAVNRDGDLGVIQEHVVKGTIAGYDDFYQ